MAKDQEEYGSEITSRYGNHIRVRVNGLLLVDDQLLCVGHQMSSSPNRLFWAPPGGGLAFGERMEEAVQREFLEETGLSVSVGEMISVTEFINDPLHAVELFFKITSHHGILQKGKDPEHDRKDQIICQVKFIPVSELNRMPPEQAHVVLRKFRSFEESGSWKGFLHR
ncbi:NUDIX domain-containing protein [Dyadobacter tibetensis]|uniref:NUDIX domain-containing protein n=1 Tax=Dyadobacter tibetensis TaxID=1211851 RepID=UPI00046E63E3|nr:NUDIX domain-containing protein [Dyadobacter tibetensis]